MSGTLTLQAAGCEVIAGIAGITGAEARARVEYGAFDAAAEEVLAALASSWPGVDQILLDVDSPPQNTPAVGHVVIGVSGRPLARLKMASLVLAGHIDATGTETVPLDESSLVREIPRFVDEHRLAGVAVTGVSSLLNPAHERRAAEIVIERTGLPTVESRHLPPVADAIERAGLAAATAARMIVLKQLAASARSVFVQSRREPPPMRLARPDDAVVAALTASEHLAALLRLFSMGDVLLEVRAKITRIEGGGYACHCDDGRYDFESPTDAKAFGERHLHEQLHARLTRAGLGTADVRYTCEDRYTEIRGRKGPVRVYLESVLSARSAPAAASRSEDRHA